MLIGSEDLWVNCQNKIRKEEMSLESMIVDPLENAFDAVGAMQGQLAPLKRAAIGGAVGYAIVQIWQPSIAFDGSGKPLEFGGEEGQTYFPVWMFAAIPALIAGVLI